MLTEVPKVQQLGVFDSSIKADIVKKGHHWEECLVNTLYVIFNWLRIDRISFGHKFTCTNSHDEDS